MSEETCGTCNHSVASLSLRHSCAPQSAVDNDCCECPARFPRDMESEACCETSPSTPHSQNSIACLTTPTSQGCILGQLGAVCNKRVAVLAIIKGGHQSHEPPSGGQVSNLLDGTTLVVVTLPEEAATPSLLLLV